MTQEELNEALLTVTGSPDWALVVKGLEHDIYQTQANIFDASSWEEFNQMKGFVQGIAYVINLRGATIAAMNAAKDDSNAAL